MNDYVITILANRIISGGLNPKPGQPLTIDDIKPEYRAAVDNKIIELTIL